MKKITLLLVIIILVFGFCMYQEANLVDSKIMVTNEDELPPFLNTEKTPEIKVLVYGKIVYVNNKNVSNANLRYETKIDSYERAYEKKSVN